MLQNFTTDFHPTVFQSTETYLFFEAPQCFTTDFQNPTVFQSTETHIFLEVPQYFKISRQIFIRQYFNRQKSISSSILDSISKFLNHKITICIDIYLNLEKSTVLQEFIITSRLIYLVTKADCATHEMTNPSIHKLFGNHLHSNIKTIELVKLHPYHQS